MRYRLVTVLTVLLVASACSALERPLPTLDEMAAAVGADVLTALRNGYFPRRSGEILLVPKPWNVLAQWTGGLRGERDPRTTHSTPWSYHQRVPVALYGPGYIRSGQQVDRSVTVADLTPTFARLLDMPFPTRDGHVLGEALLPGAEERPPRAIVVVAIDGGGWNVLEQWPDAWPEQRRLMAAGTTYTNATVGSSPSVTAPIHGTIGTGAYPATHGIPENTGRLPGGELGDLTEDGDLRLLRAETLADAWDRATGNRSWVGMIGYETWHLLMMGRGSAAPGGDADVGVLWDRDEEVFRASEPTYRLPDTLPAASRLDAHLRELDISDGAEDRLWRGHTVDPVSYAFTANPAFAQYQGEGAVAIAAREPIGLDDVPDLYFVEMKTGDVAGHVWNMVHEDFEVVLRAQDRALGELVRVLDRRIGPERYVLAMTADHGQSPVPEEVGGLRIDRFELGEDLQDEFGPVLEDVHPSDVFLDLDAVQELGTSVEEIARWIGDYRYRDGLPEGAETGEIPESILRRRVFAAALPGDWVAELSPAELSAYGEGLYAEGDLTSPSVEVNLRR